MGFYMVKWFMESAPAALPAAAKYVAVAIAMAQHDQNQEPVALSLPELVARTRFSERTVQAAITHLIDAKLLDRVVSKGGRTRSTYALRVAGIATLNDGQGSRNCYPNTSRGADIATLENARGADIATLEGQELLPYESDSSKENTLEQRTTLTSRSARAPARAPHRIPDDWTLTDELRAYAIKVGIPKAEVEDAAENFRLYWVGAGKPKADWTATFQGWMRKEAKALAASVRPSNGHVPNGRVRDLPPAERRPALPRFEDIAHRYTKESS